MFVFTFLHLTMFAMLAVRNGNGNHACLSKGTKTMLSTMLPHGRDRNSGVGCATIFGAGCNAALVGKMLEYAVRV